MAGRTELGDIHVQFRHQGHQCLISLSADDRETLKRVSGTSETIEGYKVPKWIELTTSGGADPDMRIRVELRDGAPQIVELAWTSQSHQSEIRQKHLRQIDLVKLVTDLVSSTLATDHPPRADNVRAQIEQIRQSKDPESEADYADYVDESVVLLRKAKRESERARRVAAKFTERQRLPRERRMITDSHLRLVAEVYRENLRSGPTKAVGKHFGVANRMASTYVDKARKAGYLPPTKQGQKKA